MAFPKRKNLHETSPRHLVIIGSRNQVKVTCTEEAFRMVLGGQVLTQGLNIGADGDNAPSSDEEIARNAYTRAANAKSAFPEADFWVGIEGGMEEVEGDVWVYGWVVVMDKEGKVGRAKTAVFSVPKEARDLINQEIEPEQAVNETQVPSQVKNRRSAVATLTNGAVEKKDLYRQAVMLALIPFRKG